MIKIAFHRGISIGVLGLLVAARATAYAAPADVSAPYTLECAQKNDEPIHLIVDPGKQLITEVIKEVGSYTLTHFISPMKITSTTDRYLTAFSDAKDYDKKIVGGQIFVLDRATGDLQTTSVGLVCTLHRSDWEHGPPLDGLSFCKNHAEIKTDTTSTHCIRLNNEPR